MFEETISEEYTVKTLSIIVPFSNGLFYLDDCFESILAQNLIPEEYEVSHENEDGSVIYLMTPEQYEK